MKICLVPAEETGIYRVERDGVSVGTLVPGRRMPEAVRQLDWHNGIRPVWLHGLDLPSEEAEEALELIKAEALRLGFDSLRTGFPCKGPGARQAGTLPGTQCTCFELPLSEACPLLPLRMYASYRHGEMTPWGGSRLHTVYGRDIPDDRTGEAMEVSAIPKLESHSAMGEALSDLMALNGARLTGEAWKDEFPLLLKLLDAKGSLSVQVHPDDAYAREHENKLGKTEAWVILQAQEGAGILYGLRDGVTLDRLRSGLESGEDIEPLIDRVSVQPGDVFYMPAGMVHAIGGGILLYEIQQSSDVTYRLWDFNRTNAAGEKRPLHIRQSLDVIRPELRGQRAVLPAEGENRMVRLLDVPAFQLDCACVSGSLTLPAREDSFRILTALAALSLSWEGGTMALGEGESVLLPAACPALCLMGTGRALLASPR